MEMKYHCENEYCSYPGEGEFGLTIQSEGIMDLNNIATIFCAFCKKQMVPESFEEKMAS